MRAPIPDERRQPQIRGALPSCIAGGDRHTGMEAGERVHPHAPTRSRPDQQSVAPPLPELRALVGSLRAIASGGYIPGSNEHDTRLFAYTSAGPPGSIMDA